LQQRNEKCELLRVIDIFAEVHFFAKSKKKLEKTSPFIIFFRGEW
jgi:hypothetical protein